MAGIKAEQQETSVIKAINDAVIKVNRPISVIAGSCIKDVIFASKYLGRQESGCEPLTDVVLELANGSNFRLSLKGRTTPSIAGGRP